MMQPKTTSLLDLPEDILLTICYFLELSNLKNMYSVSKKFYKLISNNPQLIKNIVKTELANRSEFVASGFRRLRNPNEKLFIEKVSREDIVAANHVINKIDALDDLKETYTYTLKTKKSIDEYKELSNTSQSKMPIAVKLFLAILNALSCMTCVIPGFVGLLMFIFNAFELNQASQICFIIAGISALICIPGLAYSCVQKQIDGLLLDSKKGINKLDEEAPLVIKDLANEANNEEYHSLKTPVNCSV